MDAAYAVIVLGYFRLSFPPTKRNKVGERIECPNGVYKNSIFASMTNCCMSHTALIHRQTENIALEGCLRLKCGECIKSRRCIVTSLSV